MRFVSKLTIAVAAIFFALSVSAHADDLTESYFSKSYQVCGKWLHMIQYELGMNRRYCGRVLTFYSLANGGVNSRARAQAKFCLRGRLDMCPTESQLLESEIYP